MQVHVQYMFAYTYMTLKIIETPEQQGNTTQISQITRFLEKNYVATL